MSKDINIEPSLVERISDIMDTGMLLVVEPILGPFNEAAMRSPGIPSNIILPLIKDALKEQRTEPYLATLLLVTNLGQPIKYHGKSFSTWKDFFPALVEIHNAEQPSFNTKRRRFLKALIRSGFANHKQLDDCGLTKNHYHPETNDSNDTPWDILVAQDDKVLHDRRPTHVNPDGVTEAGENTAKTSYAAIAKKDFLPLIKSALESQRMNIIQASLMIAINVHSMELRRDDTRYIDHVMAVAADPTLTPRQSLIAILHDVLENSLWTAEDLRNIGFEESLVRSVEYLTKRDNENYMEFIQRVSTNVDALAVKMADIRHNTPSAKPDKKGKYEVAMEYLAAVQNGDIKPGSSIRDFTHAINIYNESHFAPENKNPNVSNDNKRPTLAHPVPGMPAPGNSWAA